MPGSSPNRRQKMKASGTFATHLSIFDDDIKFDVEQEEGLIGERQVPPSVLCSSVEVERDEKAGGDRGDRGDGDSTQTDPPPAKVRRKCGRPRNPIPRHKRESHISAEYRRRGKIQNGFQTLKFLVPRGGESSSGGRDSKADILFKAVDFLKKTEVDIHKQEEEIEEIRGEIKQLHAELEDYQRSMPVASPFPESSQDLDAMFEDYVSLQTHHNWRFWIFSFLARPLFQSFRSAVGGGSREEVAHSVQSWAENHLNVHNLSSVMLDALRHMNAQSPLVLDSSHYHGDAPPLQNGQMYDVTTAGHAYHPAVDQSAPSSLSSHDDSGCVHSLTASLEEDSLHQESLIQICQSLLPIDQLKREVLAHNDPPPSDPSHAHYINHYHSHHFYDHMDSTFQPMAPCYTSL